MHSGTGTGAGTGTEKRVPMGDTFLGRAMGFEPTTSGTTNRRSNQLS
jgi:hypothetical protein